MSNVKQYKRREKGKGIWGMGVRSSLIPYPIMLTPNKLFFCFLAFLIMLTGCTKVGDYSFVNYGLNTKTNEIVKSADGQSVSWVSQDVSGEKVMNRIFSATNTGKNKTELLSMELEKERSLRILGFYPENSVFVYAIEYQNPNFGVAVQRETFYKFFNEDNSHSIGKDYLRFFKTDRGVMGLRVGDVLAYYQLSMNNAYAVDSKSNYIQDSKVKALFTDAQLTPDLKKIVYTFEYEPATQGYNQNKLMVSDFYGENRKELVASDKSIDILEMIGNDKVKVKVGDEEKEFSF
ncbi:MAG: hypothetical protein UT32_C0009G0021 [Parcubacteria group bacterium GW2011_GWC2_39_14]|nr:MAG: hypothetical protein UT32_C0009G0021 [Parcubacteria group bacterium GW2011_GWC2_39_14]KKR55360.1 MAG: hypothetical protein UT91_C0002G0021 [Parcubacteria group bacterium GW2011_GWA2_40_23]